MPASRIEFKKSAEKEFQRLPKDVIRRFVDAIDQLATDPRKARTGVDIKRLHGTKSTWRLRVGDYRGIYELVEDRVVFTRFAHRAKVYDV
jgi:mRNA interferase RelE/StbE